jgi:ABC-type transport system involved in multi-copper enzyme maturation permease subunit
MVGPVFGAELLRAGRRGRAHVLRWLFAGWLLVQFWFASLDMATFGPLGAGAQTAAWARGLADTFLVQQFLLIGLATPAFAAGAITDEKTRGTLPNLLTAHLWSWEIVVGKLLARAVQVWALCLVVLPLLAFVGPYAGLSGPFAAAWVVVTGLVVLGLSAASVLASVWVRQTRAAVLLVYGAVAAAWAYGAAWAAVLPGWVHGFDPLEPLRVAYMTDDAGELFRRLRDAAVCWGGMGVLCTAVAAWRLRPAYVRQLHARRRLPWLPPALAGRPAVRGHPLAWKEQFVGRRVPAWLSAPLIAGPVIWYVVTEITPPAVTTRGPSPLWGEWIAAGMWVLLGLTLLVGVRASGAISGERERHTWDGLLTAPFSARDLVRGKLRGILAAAWPPLLTFYLAAAVVIGGLMAAADALLPLFVLGLVLAVAAAGLVAWVEPRLGRWAAAGVAVVAAGFGGAVPVLITAVGLGVTWLAMTFMGAVGLWCSARSPSSWRSLLGTVALGYFGGVGLYCASTPLMCVASIVLFFVTGMLQALFGQGAVARAWLTTWGVVYPLAGFVGMALTYWWAARWLLVAAENHIIRHDRIPPGYLRLIALDQPYRPVGRPRRLTK